jgi:hypothetical protein
MGFLSGSVGFERFEVRGFDSTQFSEEHIKILSENVIRSSNSSDTELVKVGFIGGDHLFDTEFSAEKNIINDALHFALRIDTNQVPSAIKKAWLQLELNGICKDNKSGKPTKSQREEAKDAVEHRCQTEAATGKYRKMSMTSVLWDLNQHALYFAGSGSATLTKFSELFEAAFSVELGMFSSGSIASAWAAQNNATEALENSAPSAFIPEHADGGLAWANPDAANFDFLGNEFLMWLWWSLESETDTIRLPDETEVAVMLNRTLSLQCPFGEHGKETITAEAPTQLPEAMQAIQTGKLPRKSGITLVRQGFEFNLVLQPETFSISAAKMKCDDDDDPQYKSENRIEAIRYMNETLDLLFQTFCERRLGNAWNNHLSGIQAWLRPTESTTKKKAA